VRGYEQTVQVGDASRTSLRQGTWITETKAGAMVGHA
jgi:hypothetical protein